MKREQVAFDVALQIYGELAEASQILNRHPQLSKKQRNACLAHVSSAFTKSGDIRELLLGRLSPRDYLKGQSQASPASGG